MYIARMNDVESQSIVLSDEEGNEEGNEDNRPTYVDNEDNNMNVMED